MRNLNILWHLISLIFVASCGDIDKTKKQEKIRETAMEWYSPEDPEPREQCPCCDYISLPERGNFLICPICFWEDDGQDVDELDAPSAPNHGITLREGRANFEKFGACEKEMLEHVIPAEERKNFKRQVRKI
jgi:hypothetical protein